MTGVSGAGATAGVAEANMNAAPLLLYGGTFDPIHAGHLAVARAVASAAGQPVTMLPAALPPHRPQPGASDSQRLAMLQQAVQADPCLLVSDQELRRSGPSYTVLTLRECQALARPVALVLGWDAFCGLPQWREPEAILALAILIVLPRPQVAQVPALLHARWQARRPLDPASLREARPGDVLFCSIPEHPASATAIRSALQRGERYPEGLPAAVADYIHEQGLYAS